MVFTKADLWKPTYVSTREVEWNTRMCRELQAWRLIITATTYRTVCYDIAGLYNALEMYVCKFKFNKKKTKMTFFVHGKYEVSVLETCGKPVYLTLY